MYMYTCTSVGLYTHVHYMVVQGREVNRPVRMYRHTMS